MCFVLVFPTGRHLTFSKIALVKMLKADSTQKMLAVIRCRIPCLPVCYLEISPSSSSGWRCGPLTPAQSSSNRVDLGYGIHRYSEAHCGSSQQCVFLREGVLSPSLNPLPGAAGNLFLSVPSLLNSLARETLPVATIPPGYLSGSSDHASPTTMS